MGIRKGSCVHFTGIQHDGCKAGIRYDAVRSDGLPCIAGNSPPSGITCDSYLEPTAEEIAAHEAEIDAYLDRMRKAMGPVNEWIKAQGWSKRNKVSATGTVPCAACGTGTFHLSMAAYNGHVWGRCTTAGCVSWVQ